MKTISIVSTQLQFINAVERVMLAKVKDNTLILDCSSRSRREQLERLLNLDLYRGVFNKVHSTSISNYLLVHIDFIYAKVLIYLLTLLNRYELLIIGNYNSLKHKYLVDCGFLFRKCAHGVVVDDGTLSLFYAEVRAKEKLSNSCDKSSECSLFYKCLFYNNFKRIVQSEIEFFSLYDLKFITSDVVLKNTFDYLSKNINLIDYGSELKLYEKVIIGQPFIAMNVLSKESYSKVIKAIIADTKKCKVLYVSHPAEIEYSFSELGIRIIKFPLPFECLVKLLNSSAIIYGFTSSALINSKKLCPDMSIVAVNLLSVFYDGSEFVEVSSKIYSSFQKSGIELIQYN